MVMVVSFRPRLFGLGYPRQPSPDNGKFADSMRKRLLACEHNSVDFNSQKMNLNEVRKRIAADLVIEYRRRRLCKIIVRH